MNNRILRLAIPNIITNITVPLLGIVDLAIVGHLGDETYIGAIAIGTMIFNFIYWNFGFLRMGTSGFTAQAYGAKKFKEAILVLERACIIALFISLTIIVLQYPIGKFSLWIIDSSTEMENLAYQYFKIRIWAAPATLGLYAFKGWFIGMQNANTPMILAIFINIINIIASFILAITFDMGIAGVAWGTLIAQWAGLFLSLIVWWKYYRKLFIYIDLKAGFHWKELSYFFKINSDIFLRSLCLVAVFSFLPIAGAKMGDEILAINTLLLQYFTIFSYIMDGFAYAGEALTGKYIGAQDRISLHKTIRGLFRWGFVLSILFTAIYAFGGNVLLHIFTDNVDIINASSQFYVWVLLVPLTGFGAFLWDGIFIGATASKDMRNCMFIATTCFFVIYYSCVNIMGNNALWLALIVFLFLRGVLQHFKAKNAIWKQIK